MMDRCPNCGSSVRVGAKFCTTCGFRLPVQAPLSQDQPHARSPFDTTSTTYVASRWPTIGSPATPGEPTPPSAASDLESEEAAAESIEPAIPDLGESTAVVGPEPVESQPFTGWPTHGSGARAPKEWGGSVESVPEPPEPVPSTGDVKSVEDAIFAWSDSTDSKPDNDSQTLPDEIEVPVAETDAFDEASAETWIASVEAESEVIAATTDEALIVAEGEMPLPAEPETEQAITEGDEEFGVPELADLAEQDVTEPAEIPGPAVETESYIVEDSPIERAKRLVAELGELLPMLESSAEAGPGTTGRIADALAASRSEGGTEAAGLQSLRAAVATAQARPRDVDVMLDLVARADAIAAVFKAHDRYAEAIDDAIAELRGEKKADPKPLW